MLVHIGSEIIRLSESIFPNVISHGRMRPPPLHGVHMDDICIHTCMRSKFKVETGQPSAVGVSYSGLSCAGVVEQYSVLCNQSATMLDHIASSV